MSCSTRRGLSLIEVLVAVAILGMLVALALMALGRTREAARRARCASNLHGLGLALNQHLAARGAFPVGVGERSFLWALLPHLEAQPLDNARVDESSGAVPIPGLFLCPSDARRRAAMAEFATSYAGNAGTFGREPVSTWDGAFTETPLMPGNVTDGLGATVVVAEWVVGDGDDQRPSRLGSITILDGDFGGDGAGPAAFASACEGAIPGRSGPVAATFKGSYWFRGRLGHSLLTHALPPNRPSCRAAPDLNAITAGSNHRGGAHVLMFDGGARFVSDSVAPAVWRALGTRAGGEAVAGGAY